MEKLPAWFSPQSTLQRREITCIFYSMSVTNSVFKELSNFIFIDFEDLLVFSLSICLHVCICTMCMLVPLKLELQVVMRHLCTCWSLNLGSLQDQPGLVTAVVSLQPTFYFVFKRLLFIYLWCEYVRVRLVFLCSMLRYPRSQREHHQIP